MRGAIIGKDIDYSKSPELYMSYFDHVGIEGRYEVLNFDSEDDLRSFILSGDVKAYDFVNITQPYKNVFMEYMDNDSIIVNECASVNLIIVEDDELIGYNTDAEGFYNYYFDELVGCSVEKILLVGTGALARTVRVYTKQATTAELVVMSPRNNPIPEFFNDLKIYHPSNTINEVSDFDLMIFAASHKAEETVSDMSLGIEKIINLNYQSKVLESYAELNALEYIDGKFMLLEQFKENLRMLNIYDRNYDFDKLLKKVFKN